MKQHKSKFVKIVKKVDHKNLKKALKFQNEKNSQSSKSDTESESTDSSVLIQRAKKEILVKLKVM